MGTGLGPNTSHLENICAEMRAQVRMKQSMDTPSHLRGPLRADPANGCYFADDNAQAVRLEDGSQSLPMSNNTLAGDCSVQHLLGT